jgi:hypothetical protein
MLRLYRRKIELGPSDRVYSLSIKLTCYRRVGKTCIVSWSSKPCIDIHLVFRPVQQHIMYKYRARTSYTLFKTKKHTSSSLNLSTIRHLTRRELRRMTSHPPSPSSHHHTSPNSDIQHHSHGVFLYSQHYYKGVTVSHIPHPTSYIPTPNPRLTLGKLIPTQPNPSHHISPRYPRPEPHSIPLSAYPN